MENKLIYNKLFNAYSPIKTNKDLLRSYISITRENPSNKNIRKEYNTIITKNYVNESVVKASFLKRHAFKLSPRLNTTIFELNSNNSRADLAIINGSSEVFEIKTEYDSFTRLEQQLKDYFLLFDYVNIIIPKDHFNNDIKNLPDCLGIITYYQNRLGNIAFKRLKKPSYNENKNPQTQLSSMTKGALLKILNSKNWSLDKEVIIEEISKKKTGNDINIIFKEYLKDKYRDNWKFLYNNRNNIEVLDYQWFFKNNLDYKIVYR